MALSMMIAAGIAGVFHILFFILESVTWGKSISNKIFRIQEGEVETVRLWAFNQGFYNFLIAVGTFVGIWLVQNKRPGIGYTFLVNNCAIMLGAAIVLVVSKPKMYRGALIQGIPPLVFLILFWLY